MGGSFKIGVIIQHRIESPIPGDTFRHPSRSAVAIHDARRPCHGAFDPVSEFELNSYFLLNVIYIAREILSRESAYLG